MIKRIPFLDLRVESDADRQELLAAVDAVFRHGRLVMGPEVEELERQVAAYCGRQFGVGVNSGTDALLLALKSLGLGPGDEVITTSLSWIATANAIALTGATPVFADIRGDLNIDLVRRLVRRGAEDIKLSPKEYDILEQLAIHAGKVLTHKHLLREVWRDESVDPQYLRVYVRQLRQKVETDPSTPRHVLTEPGVGYRLV